jgi:zinc finger SWIM domain-containing protein 3
MQMATCLTLVERRMRCLSKVTGLLVHKQELSSTLNNLKVDHFAFKYFLPKNDKTLISISNDKDLRHMVEFHAESASTDIYIMKNADNR